MSGSCPFCDPSSERVFLRLHCAFALWDAYPVTAGHALLIPFRHVSDWFAASPEERSELFGAIDTVCAVIQRRYGADGFNVGFNLGRPAGQTVPHLHLHVIPRRTGDVSDPTGGIRHVIPGKGNYLALGQEFAALGIDPANLEQPLVRDAASPQGYRPVTQPARDFALTTGGDRPLLPSLEEDLSAARSVDIAVAFILHSGLDRLYPHLIDLFQRGGRLRLLSGDYLGVTDPDALQRLLDLREIAGLDRCALRMFVCNDQSFHPKAYLISQSDGTSVAYIGSSNLSRSALIDGVEWNSRVTSTRDIFAWSQIEVAFDALFCHASTVDLNDEWLRRYRTRREQSARVVLPLDIAPEEKAPPPEPNHVQKEALERLEATRREGYRAGLVVMATGLGKTWLAAFDTDRAQFQRILFVAHREEILTQAIATFRRIRPNASIGLYSGGNHPADKQLIFASIQTLSRKDHLSRFEPTDFDYIVVDEFHHAAADTYRRLINYFSPKFLIGLTATPERADGGDLLSLCDDNVVYRCSIPRGIDLGLLCEFDYFGVPDDIDYTNIPWRSSRFDEEALTAALVTRRRAENTYAQWRQLGGSRTIAFCVSQRHADYMRRRFQEWDVACAAVHSGPSSDERTQSLMRLASGELAVVFAVDMFNEGADVPTIDTVMMLRPTESPIVWLQQFGRGLRRNGDKRLSVIDYIGNHRSFLTKLRTLLDLEGKSDRELRVALERIESDEYELPRGCSVTYELEALNILRALLRTGEAPVDVLREYYEDFRMRNGQRPTAYEAFTDGYLPRAARTSYGSWLGFVESQGDLTPSQAGALAVSRPFLVGLETTRMARSFKMLVLIAMLNANALPGKGLTIDDLAVEFKRLASRSPRLISDVGVDLDNRGALRSYLQENPIAAWSGPGAIADDVFFTVEGNQFRFAREIPEQARSGFQELVRELADWRLAEYLRRTDPTRLADTFTMKVSHASGRPILFYDPGVERSKMPEGWQPVTIDGVKHEANFVKIAVNVVRLVGTPENRLPGILRGWFGADAGRPGTNQHVVCEMRKEGLVFRRLSTIDSENATRFKRYTREQIPRLFGEQFNPAIWNSGFIVIEPSAPKHLCLLVTLKKEDMPEEFQYSDHFLSPDLFEWHSQNRTRAESAHGRLIRNHQELGVQVHLFVRAEKKRAGIAAAFVYCGAVSFVDWKGESPITVRWRLSEPVPEPIQSELGIRRPS